MPGHLTFYDVLIALVALPASLNNAAKIREQYRGQGIFRAMYSKVLEMAKEQNIAQIRLYVDRHNTNAQLVYQKLGMEECHYLMYETSPQ